MELLFQRKVFDNMSHKDTKEEKGHGRRGWMFLGSRGALDTPCCTPAPPAPPPSRWACSFHLLGARQWGAPKTPSWGWWCGSWTPGNPRPCSRSVHCEKASLTEWSGPVHSGHPLWIPGGGAAAPSAHLGLRRWRRNWAVLPTSYPENDKGQFQKWEQGGQSESWVSQGPCEEGFAAAWIPLGWFPFCVVFTSDHKDEAVQVPIASLAQVLTTLLIYYGQGDRVAGVTLPWAREETP